MTGFKTLVTGTVLAACLVTAGRDAAAAPDLTAAGWLLSGSDVGGNNWTGSTITFERQSASGLTFVLSGWFYWTGNGGAYFGRENFTGTLFASNHLTLTGIGIVPPSSGLISGAMYEADVTADGHRLVNGTWGGPGGLGSNAWTAVQAVPEPSLPALLLPGLLLTGIAAAGRRRAVSRRRAAPPAARAS